MDFALQKNHSFFMKKGKSLSQEEEEKLMCFFGRKSMAIVILIVSSREPLQRIYDTKAHACSHAHTRPHTTRMHTY
jgi:hypothetical protein